MSLTHNYPLTIRTLAFLALITIFVLITGDAVTHYFELIYFVPGLIFSALVAITLKNEKRFFWIAGFVFISTLLYSLTYLGSLILSFVGVCIVPSIGALLFIGLINTLMGQSISNRAVLYSLLSGPISGGITLLIIFIFKDTFGLIFFLPIPIWWIFMSVLIDITTQKKENV